MKKLKKKQLMNGYIFICVLFMSIFLLVTTQKVSNINVLVYLTFLANEILVIIHMFKSSKLGYSLIDMFDIFMLFFMFVAPILQYLNDGFPWWKTYLITDEVVILGNIIIFLFLNIVYITYSLNKDSISNKTKKMNDRMSFTNVKIIQDIGFYISLVISLYIIQQTGFLNLFSRSTNSLGYDSQIATLIVGNSFKAFPLITLLLKIYFKKTHGYFYKKWQVVILLLFTVLLHFPTGMARFQVAVVYLALIIAYKQNFKNKYLFKLAVVLGLLIVFPFINIFRNNSFTDLINLSISFPNPVDTFVHGDFDAYSMFMRAIIYVKNIGITYGKQFLGVILFFIPRFLWSSKPVGSGQMVAESMGFEFTNVSMPFIGEAYINFGILGIIIFSFLLGKLMSNLDTIFVLLHEKRNKHKIYILEIVYPLLIGFLFFILRGDLLSSFSFTSGYILPIIFLFLVDKLLSQVHNPV